MEMNLVGRIVHNLAEPVIGGVERLHVVMGDRQDATLGVGKADETEIAVLVELDDRRRVANVECVGADAEPLSGSKALRACSIR